VKKIFKAIIPDWEGRKLPAAFPFHIRLVLRCSVLIAWFFALKKYGKTFSMLSQEKRVELMDYLYNHPSASIRNMVQWWKLTALMLQC